MLHAHAWIVDVDLTAERGPAMRADASERLTIAHDYFTQRGGAERVATALINALDPDRVVTAIHVPSATFEIGDNRARVETTFLQRLSAFREDPRRALPAFPLAWRTVAPVLSGVVLCSSSGWSHAIRTDPGVRKIVYCHNPARWLYQADDYLKDQSALVRLTMWLIRPILIRWDRQAADSASLYIANSSAVARRIKAAYGVVAAVIPPPVSIDPHDDQEPVSIPDGEFFLSVGRARGYKNVRVLEAGFALVPTAQLVVVGATPSGDHPANVHYTGRVSDAQLRWLYARCRAVVSVSNEDFGLTPIEANMFGAPALVLRAGGFLDSLDEGVSGEYIEEGTPDSIAGAVRSFRRDWDRATIEAHGAKFSVENFIRRLKETAGLPLLHSELDQAA